jgi:PAS domain S-box-containing protein
MPPNKPERSSRRKGTLRELSDLYDRLLKREAQLRAALYSIGDALMITDTDGSITLMNPAAERLTGWTESEALALPIEQVFRIVDEDTRAAIENPVTRTLRTGTVVRLHHRTLLISRDGREIPIADAGAPIRDESGDMTGVITLSPTSSSTSVNAQCY